MLLALALHQSGLAMQLSSDPSVELLLRVSGQMVVGVAMAAMAWAMLTFRRARTAIMPHHAASQLVTEGPYRYSRNPMYVCLVLIQAGLCLVYNTPWPLLLLPPVVLFVQYRVILREERYLAAAFGQQYLDYCSEVGRWLWPLPRLQERRPLSG